LLLLLKNIPLPRTEARTTTSCIYQKIQVLILWAFSHCLTPLRANILRPVFTKCGNSVVFKRAERNRPTNIIFNSELKAQVRAIFLYRLYVIVKDVTRDIDLRGQTRLAGRWVSGSLSVTKWEERGGSWIGLARKCCLGFSRKRKISLKSKNFAKISAKIMKICTTFRENKIFLRKFCKFPRTINFL